MLGAFRQLDRILRGDATQLGDLRRGQLEVRVGSVVPLVVLLAVVYGACVGAYSLTLADNDVGAKQLIASAVKMPLLFVLTTLVTLPSLYVYNALVGSRLTVDSVYRLLIASLGVTVAVAASQGPIVVFFAVSTTSYPFMILLNVVSLGVAGVFGLAFLNRTLTRLAHVHDRELQHGPQEAHQETATDGEAPKTNPAADPVFRSAVDKGGLPTFRQSTLVFRIWLVVFGLVGAQMSWVLRPFIGSPDMAFTWFRARESNFFEGLFRALANLFQ